MAVILPFPGIRPRRELAARVAAPPYDVVTSFEARKLAAGNPFSFLHINKPEIDLDPSIDPHDPLVYRTGALSLRRFLQDDILRRDETPAFYVYRQIQRDHEQTGLVAVVPLEEYQRGRVLRHELTRPDKEDDRVRHMDQLNAQVGPVFLAYRAREEIHSLVGALTAGELEYDFPADGGVRHVFWKVGEAGMKVDITAAFASVPRLYVADGHHRLAAAARVRDLRRQAGLNQRGDEPWNFFLAALFPHDRLRVLGYHRLVKDLGGLDAAGLLRALEETFEISGPHDGRRAEPERPGVFGLCLAGQWYRLAFRQAPSGVEDPVARLDVSRLQECILAPILRIGDPRTDPRLHFLGGAGAVKTLEKRVRDGQYAAAFTCYPTSVEDLMAVADAGCLMPPKSTWFEPKLKSGLVVHALDGE